MSTEHEHPHHPLTCSAVEQDMVAYLKGGLPPGRREAFRQHCLACAQCDQAVQQARALEAELRLEALRVRRGIPPISADVSAQIQGKVYRRMRRALWFQRSVNMAQRAVTVILLAMVLVFALILFNPWRQQLATLGTAAPQETVAPDGASVDGVEEVIATGPAPAGGEEESLPTLLTATPLPPASPTPFPDQRDSDAPALNGLPVTTIVARELPLDAATAIVDAAIAANDQQLVRLLERTQPLPEASFRVWRRLERCQGIIDAGDLDYRVMIHRDRFASIYVFNADGRYLGDLKLWLDQEGIWYLSTLNYSSFSALNYDCRR
jgi:hypothetical protein